MLARCVSRFGAAGVAAAVLMAAGADARAERCFGELVLDGEAEGARRVITATIDSDTDIDVVLASDEGLAWYESDGGDPPSFTEHVLDADAEFVVSLAAADVNSDGHTDIVAVYPNDNEVVWFKSDGGSPPTLDPVPIPVSYDEPFSVSVGDLDGDLDLDLAVAFANGDAVAWYANSGGVAPVFTEREITASLNGPWWIEIADIDGDTRNDIVLAVAFANRVVWFQNSGDPVPAFGLREVGANMQTPVALSIEDIDGDGDRDIVSGSAGGDIVTWHENGGAPLYLFTAHTLQTDADNVRSVVATDLDNDSDIDVLVAATNDDSVWWHENDGAMEPAFTQRLISSNADVTASVAAADLDGDGDPDVLAAASAISTLLWFENDVPVLNEQTAESFPLLSGAIAAATAGERLIAVSGQFGCGCTPELDFLDKAIEVASTGGIRRDEPSTTTLGTGSLLSAFGPVDLRGAVTLGDGSIVRSMGAARSSGSEVTVTGPLTVPDGLSGELDANAVLIRGPLSLGVGSELVAPSLSLGSPALFTGRDAATDLAGVIAVVAEDLTGDGRRDPVVAVGALGTVVYFDNQGGEPPAFVRRDLATGLGSVTDVFVADMDGDLIPDVVVSEEGAGRVDWFESNGGAIPSFTRREITDVGGGITSPGARDVHVADLDADGDLDVVVAATLTDQLHWYESDGGDPPTFTQREATDLVGGVIADGVRSVHAADVNGDGAIDLLSASFSDALVAWYESDGADEPTFTQREITTNTPGAHGVSAVDIEGDGDVDVLAAAWVGNKVSLFENDGSDPPVFTERILTSDSRAATRVFAADLTGDGFVEVLSSSRNDGAIRWFESVRGAGAQRDFVERFVTRDAPGAWDVAAADIDGDGDADVLSVSEGDSSLTWYENALEISLRLQSAGSALRADADVVIENRAGVRLGGSARLEAGGEVVVRRGSGLFGRGVVTAPTIRSGGVIRPDRGQALTLEGAYVQRSTEPGLGEKTGRVELALGDGTSPAAVAITGGAALAGALVAEADPGFAPEVGERFEILTAATLGGSRFDVALLPNIGGDRFLSVIYEEGAQRAGARVVLEALPLAGDVDLDPGSGADSGIAGVPRGATIADIDADGDDDLVLALPDAANPAFQRGSVVILPNASDGDPGNGWEGFGSAIQIFEGVGVDPSGVSVGLLDDDALPDIAVTNRGDDTVSLIMIKDLTQLEFLTHEDVDGAGQLLTTGAAPADVAVFDLDGDGFDDVATANSEGHSVTIAFNPGVAKTSKWFFVDPQEFDLPVEDECPLSIRPGEASFGRSLGGLGGRFLATANSGNNSIGLIQVNADQTVVVLPNTPTGLDPREVIVADLNLDGDDDVASVNRSGNSVSVSLNLTSQNDGSLTLGPTAELSIGATQDPPRSFAGGDYDGDGDLDLAVLADGEVKVWRNDLAGGQLTYTPADEQPATAGALLVRGGDVNGDGRADVVTVSPSSAANKRASVRTGDEETTSVGTLVAAPACPGDVDGDGDTDVFDFAELADNFDRGPGFTRAQGDLTGDGVIDVMDFMVLAEDFGCAPPTAR